MRAADTDVIIAGAGPAGCLLAGLLARQGISCRIIDRQMLPGDPWGPETDPRAIAITPFSAGLLAEIHAWSALPADRIGRFAGMEVWDAVSTGRLSFESAELCAAVLGYIIELPVLTHTLRQVIACLPQVRMIGGREIVACNHHDNSIRVTLDNGEKVEAALLVAADGTGSRVRELAGLDYYRDDYHQQAIACVVRTERPHAAVARQRFLPTGPLAFLPMAAADVSGVVWSTTPAEASELLALSEADFCERLGTAFEHRLGQVHECGPRSAFGLFRAHAPRYLAGRCVLVGDAAHCVHPLAGLGVNLGMQDVAVLAAHLGAARRQGRQISSVSALRRYERWRKGENYRMMRVLDGLRLLFEYNHGPVPALRGVGMGMVDSLPWLKQRIMAHAMGLTGAIPEDARPGTLHEIN